MDLVDEEDDVAFGLRHLLDHRFQALLKLALVFGTRHECAHIEGVELLVLQVLGHVATHDTLGQSFDDSRLARTRLTNEDRVVLRTAGEDLQDAAYLFVTADHWVEFSCPRPLHEVGGILGEGLEVFVSALALHLLSLAQRLDGLEHFLLRAASVLQDT